MITELKYALYLGISICVWKLIEFTFGFHGEHYEIGKYSGFVPLLFLIIALFLGIKERRDKSLNGFITYKQAVRTGFFICMVSTMITVVFVYVYYKIINPDYINYLLAAHEKRLMMLGTEKDAAVVALTIVKNNFSATSMMMYQFLFNLVGGVIFSCIIAFILKKDLPLENAGRISINEA